MTDLAGKTVVITGAARGQGAVEALAAARAGATVVATDVLDGEGAAVARGHDGVTYHHLDVADPAGWAALADRLRERGVRIDGLVNNAGIAQRPRLADVTVEEWNRAIAVNLTGPMLGIQTLSPLMNDGGSIVNIGSVAALTAHHAVAYTASKWGLRGLSKVAALELGPRGIRVNLVHPGYVDTPLMASANPAFVAAHLALTPAGRAGTPQDVAPLVLYLLGDESRYVNGAEITVDGGFSAHGGTKFIVDSLAS